MTDGVYIGVKYPKRYYHSIIFMSREIKLKGNPDIITEISLLYF